MSGSEQRRAIDWGGVELERAADGALVNVPDRIDLARSLLPVCIQLVGHDRITKPERGSAHFRAAVNAFQFADAFLFKLRQDAATEPAATPADGEEPSRSGL